MSQARSTRVDLKRKQVQLFCGRFTPTQGLKPAHITEEAVQNVLQIWKQYETTLKWHLVDCKQNVQAYADTQVNLGQNAIMANTL